MKFCNECIYRWLLVPVLLFGSSLMAMAGPKIEVNRTVVDLGKIYVDPDYVFSMIESDQRISVKNVGDELLTISQISKDGGLFIYGFSLAPGDSKSVGVVSSPLKLGINSYQLKIHTNDLDAPQVPISVSYEGLVMPSLIVENANGVPLVSGEATLKYEPMLADPYRSYPTTPPSQLSQVIRVRNTGEAPMAIRVNAWSPSVDGHGLNVLGRSFVIVSRPDGSWLGNDIPSFIPPSGMLDFHVSLKPSTLGDVKSKIEISTFSHSHPLVRRSSFDFFVQTVAIAVPRFSLGDDIYDRVWDPDVVPPVEYDTFHIGEFQDKLVRLRNDGTAPLTVDAEIVGENHEDFVLITQFPLTVPPLGSALVGMRFRPNDGGPRSSFLRFTSNDPDQPQFDLPLSGQGFRLVLEDPEGSNFGSVPVGGFASRTFALENKGDTPISGISVDLTSTLGGQLSLMGEVPFRLVPGERSEFTVRFTPEQMSSFSSYIMVTTLENLTKPLLLDITARGVDAPALVLASERGQISAPGETTMEVPYDSVDIGDYKRFAFDLKNKGTIPLKFSGDFLSESSEDFSLLSPLPDAVEPGARIRFEITFRPKDAGAKAAVFRILSNDPDQPAFEILLTGFGFPFSLEAPEGTIFDTTDVGDTELLEFVLVNNGDEPLQEVTALIMSETPLRALAGDVPEFALATSIPRQLAPKQRFTFQVRFKPKAVGERSIVLRLQSNNDRKRSLEVLMKGRGKLPGARDIVIRNMARENLRRDDVFLKFGQIAVGTKATRWFSIKNKTEKPLLISRISATGPYADIFRIRGAIMKEIEPGGTMKFYASCIPVQAGDIRASFVIRSVYNGVQLPLIRFKARGKAVRAGTESKLMAVSDQETTRTALTGRDVDGMAEREAGIYRFVTWIDGAGYKAVRIPNPEQGIRKPVVEVSSDLVHWQSGDLHTVVIESSPEFLVVRDAQPCRGGNRFLRVRSISR